jgi:hypothetical protein
MITFKEFRSRLNESVEYINEGTFYIFRTDTNAILAKGVPDYESAKQRANQLRKSLGLKWDQVSFKSERRAAPKQFGVSKDGKSFTDAQGHTGRVEYSRNYNPSKRGRFRGYWAPDGSFHDIS